MGRVGARIWISVLLVACLIVAGCSRGPSTSGGNNASQQIREALVVLPGVESADISFEAGSLGDSENPDGKLTGKLRTSPSAGRDQLRAIVSEFTNRRADSTLSTVLTVFTVTVPIEKPSGHVTERTFRQSRFHYSGAQIADVVDRWYDVVDRFGPAVSIDVDYLADLDIQLPAHSGLEVAHVEAALSRMLPKAVTTPPAEPEGPSYFWHVVVQAP